MDQEYIKKLYETSDFADCSFVFPNEEGKVIKGHATVLDSASPVFHFKFLYHREKAKSQSNGGFIGYFINVDNVTSHAFKALLRFIYCRDRIRTTIADLVNLYDAFDKYDCKDGKAFIIQQILKSEISSSGCVKLLQLAKNINDDLLFETCVKRLFKYRYDPAVINNISPELLNEALCYLNPNEGNDRVSSENISSIVMKYIEVNQNRFKNLNETLQPILDSLNWKAVPLKEISKCSILNNRQKLEFLKKHLKANDLKSECDRKKSEASDVEMKPVSKKRKRHGQEILMNEVATNICQHYIEQKYTDCEFVFSNGESLKAHKLFLCFSSPIFEAMFYGTVGQTNPVEIKHIKKSVFELLLKILYFLDVDLSPESSETLADLYTAAFKHQCIKALDIIREYISVRSADAFLFFGLSKKYVDEKLKKICLKFFQNPLAALKTDHFLKSDPETVCLVYKGNKVNSSGMIDLVKGLELYIKKNKDKDPQIMIEVQEALKGISFLKLKTFEILETFLLSEREKWILFAIKENCKMLTKPPTLLETKRLSLCDIRIIHMHMASDYSTWKLTQKM